MFSQANGGRSAALIALALVSISWAARAAQPAAAAAPSSLAGVQVADAAATGVTKPDELAPPHGEVEPPPLAPTPSEIASDAPAWLHLDKLPFIPVPELSTAPHSGVTFGLIPVILKNNDRNEIDTIFAPDIIYSQYFGVGARWRTFKNVSDDEKWSLVGGGKVSVEREFDAEYDLGLRRDRAWSWIFHAMYDRSGTGRFYGLGNDTQRGAQTTFIDSQERVEVTAGRNLTHDLQLSYMLRIGTAEVEQSALFGLPSIMSLYPKLVGVGDATEVHQRVVITYDSRDSIVIPRSGVRLAAFGGYTTRALGSSVNYNFLGFDGTYLHPVSPDLTIVGHTAARYMPSYSNAPFWALSSIGGETSTIGEAQPLRSYGDGRFVDRNSVSASVEARTWVYGVHMFSTDMKLELAPFIDTGKVFRTNIENPFNHLHVGGGLGLRVIASPYVVGFLDIGLGNERLAFFSGINYPF